MSKLGGVLLTAGLIFASATAASAQQGRGTIAPPLGQVPPSQTPPTVQAPPPGKGPVAVPEIDLSGGLAGLAAIGAGLLLVRERRRRS